MRGLALEEECTSRNNCAYDMLEPAFLALQLVRHTLSFLVLNLTRCNNPYVMFYSLAFSPYALSQHTSSESAGR